MDGTERMVEYGGGTGLDGHCQLARVRALVSESLAVMQRAAQELAELFPDGAGAAAVPGAGHGRAWPAGGDEPRLTPRQQEVLQLLSGGLSNRQIARVLGISEKTVKNHVHAICARLAVSGRIQAALYATRPVV